MRPAGRFVAEVLSTLIAQARVEVNLLELDELARVIQDRGAEIVLHRLSPSFEVGPFGKVLCTSVNDAVLHGLPPTTTASWSTAIWSASTAASWMVGCRTRRSVSSSARPREQDQQLIATAEAALAAGIEGGEARQQDRRHLLRHRAGGIAGGFTRSTPSSAGMVWVRTMRRPSHCRNNGGVAAGYCFGRPGDRDRAMVLAGHRQDLYRCRRMDVAEPGWLARRTRRAHRAITTAAHRPDRSLGRVKPARDRLAALRRGESNRSDQPAQLSAPPRPWVSPSTALTVIGPGRGDLGLPASNWYHQSQRSPP